MLTASTIDFETPNLPPELRRRPVSHVDKRRLDAATLGYAARRVPRDQIVTAISGDLSIDAGDLILTRVSKVGRFDFLESGDGTVKTIEAGDELVLCYAPVAGNREAVGMVATHASNFKLLNPAGIASRARSRAYAAQATELDFMGLLGDAAGNRINIVDWSIPVATVSRVSQPVIAIIGERKLPAEPCRSADMIRGLSQSGFKVGAANITGVPGCWKVNMLKKSGARVAVDITDAGYLGVSGLGVQALEKVFLSLSGYLADSGVDIMVLEIEQGVFGRDTAGIVSLPCFQNRISHIVLEGSGGQASEIERDSLRALGYSVALVDSPNQRPAYHGLI